MARVRVLLQSLSSGGPQIMATSLGSLLAFSDGMTYGWTSPMIPYFTTNPNSTSSIKMTEQEAHFMETTSLLGNAAGLPIVLYLVNKIGRKYSILTAALLSCLCWISLIFAPNTYVIFTARFFAGMAGDMCFVATPMYVAEIANANIRGILSAFVYLMMLFGVITVYSTGAYAPYYVAPLIGIILTSFQCVFFPFMPESPYFYVYIKKYEKAKDSLRWFRQRLDIDEELNNIIKSVANQKNEQGKLKDLFTDKSNRIALIIMTILNLGQHYSGITIMIMNLEPILAEANSTYISPSLSAILFALIMITGCFIASVIIDIFGRRFLLIVSSFFTTIILTVISAYFHIKSLGYNVTNISWIPAVCCLIYGITFKLGIGLVPIVLTAEIFPTPIKAIGMTISEIWYIIGGITSVNLYAWLHISYGLHVPFYLLSVCSFLVMIFCIIFVPETKGKTLEEIQEILKEL